MYSCKRIASITSLESGIVTSYAYDIMDRATNISYRTASGSLIRSLDYQYDAPGTTSFGFSCGTGDLLSLTVWTGGPGATPAATYYALKDVQNTVHAFVNGSGQIVERYEYDAWGNPTVCDASGSEISNGQSQIGNRYLWQGREYDYETKLYYFRARWYNPETGRWLSKDPIGISGGLNLYAFCGNNPVNFVDPLGLCQDDIDLLRDAFWDQMNDWVESGDRMPGTGNGWWNNFWSGLMGYYGCWDQALLMKGTLSTVNTSDVWKFNEVTVNGGKLNEHHYLEGVNSQDSSAPTLTIDPWAGVFEVNK
jgi:RHS repeat-associated protein